MKAITDKKQADKTEYKVPKFYLDGTSGDKLEPIIMKFSFAPGKRFTFYTGKRVNRENWNTERQRVKRNVTGFSEINDLLDRLESEAKEALKTAQTLKTVLTSEKLRERLNIAVGKLTAKTDFFELLDHFIETESNLKAWTSSTLKKFTTIRAQLVAFEAYQREHKKRNRIEMSEIGDSFFQELVNFWQKEYDLRNSTIQKNIQILKWFFNWCYQRKKISEDYKGVKIELKGNKKKKIIYLDLEELAKIYRLQTPPQKQYLERTKDIFIFQCLTGLRFSDLYNLKASDYKDGIIHVSTIKTGEDIEIELNETTLEIWHKYKEYQDGTGRAFPVPVNQVYNKFLKELAELAELTEKITLVHYKGAKRIEETFEKRELICSHTARRSFITNGLTVGIVPEVIKSWTGHRTDTSFKDYLEIVREKKAADIQKLTL